MTWGDSDVREVRRDTPSRLLTGGRWGLLDRLTEPSAAVTDPVDRHTARMLAAALLAVIVLGTVSAAVQLWTVPMFTSAFRVIMVGVLMIAVAYGLSRTARFRLAALLSAFIPIFGGAAVGLLRPSDPVWFAFMSIGCVVASAFLSVRAIAAVSGSCVVATVAVLAVQPDAEVARHIPSIGLFSITLAALVGLAARHRRTLERLREQELADSERRFADLYENSPDMYFTLERDSTISSVNARGAAQLGYRKEELTGRSVFAVVHPEDRAIVESQLTAAASGGAEPADLEFRKLRRDGSVLWVHERVRVIPQVGARDGSLQVVCRDVTDRKLAEQELRAGQEALQRSESEYRALFEQATYGMYRSTRDGRFLAVNPALVVMLGYESADEMLGLSLGEELYVDAAERERLIRQHVPGSAIRGVTTRWKRKDGKVITVKLSGRAVADHASGQACYEMLAEDVTEHQVLEAQLRQAQKMEVIGQLTGGIAHDINNVLTAVVGSATLIEHDLPAEFGGLRQEAQQMVAAVRRGADMIRKLLAFARQQTLQAEPLSLAAVVQDTLAILRRLLPENIEIRVSAESTEFVNVDRGAVEQILLNLATNARDAMPRGGTLTIAVRSVSVDEEFVAVHGWGEPGSYMCLSVSDTGVGMDPAALRRVFEPFYSTKPVGQGTGLGMAMVYGLVKQHGGFVSVDSTLGQGTVVRVYFPTTDARAPRRTPVPEVRAGGGGETLLVVEDEPLIRSSTARILERYGYQVLTAQDGALALAILRGGQPRVHLVITDVIMPNLSGPELYQATRALDPAPRFLFTSGYPGPEGSDVIARDVPFLEKPWTIPDLLEAVRVALS